MPKKIVVFSDGTGNSAARLQKSNVWRMYQALERLPDQIAYYDDGVGTSAFKPLAALGGAVGLGLARNVRSLYKFLCRNYQEGDKIYAFGFSRGAFTIRILIGLIAACGITAPDGDLDVHALKAWKAYRRKYRLFGRSRTIPPPERKVEVEFIGLWDTVDAYGFPIEEMRLAWDYFVWPLAMRDRKLYDGVKKAYHALSIDDERETFHPVLWTEEGAEAPKHVDLERITQVWFAGVHSNLGGGYPDDSLSHVSLRWMILQAERHGLKFEDGYKDFAFAEADEFGKIYNPRGGFSALYRYMPRPIADMCRTMSSDGKTLAVNIKRAKFHESVFRRLSNGTDAYAPFTLPDQYDVVLNTGEIVPGVIAVKSDLERSARETEAHAKQRCDQQFKLWDLVWRRRRVYFVTLFFTLLTVALPWLIDRQWIDWGARTGLLSFVPTVLDFVLPDYIDSWLDFYRVNPLLLTVLIGLAFGFGVFGARMERRSRRLMHEIWGQSLRGGKGPREELPSGDLHRRKNSPSWDRFRRFYRYKLAPYALGIVFYAAGLVIAHQLVAKVVENFGVTCGWPIAADADRTGFDTTEPCHATSSPVTAGETYRVVVTVTEPWYDKSIAAGPDGLHEMGLGARLLMTAAVPLRRHITEGWFKVMAKIDAAGLDSQALDLRRTDATDAAGNEIWAAKFTADADGELFVYVNDATLFGLPLVFYPNNHGAATITIESKAN